MTTTFEVVADPARRALLDSLIDGPQAVGELDPGGRVRFLALPNVPAMADGEVLAIDPPRLLSHTWGEDRLTWELRPHGAGCLLVLTHSFGGRFKAARDGAGWHICLWWLA